MLPSQHSTTLFCFGSVSFSPQRQGLPEWSGSPKHIKTPHPLPHSRSPASKHLNNGCVSPDCSSLLRGPPAPVYVDTGPSVLMTVNLWGAGPEGCADTHKTLPHPLWSPKAGQTPGVPTAQTEAPAEVGVVEGGGWGTAGPQVRPSLPAGNESLGTRRVENTPAPLGAPSPTRPAQRASPETPQTPGGAVGVGQR